MTKKYILALFLFLSLLIISYFVQISSRTTAQVKEVYNNTDQFEIKEIKGQEEYQLNAFYPVTKYDTFNKAILEKVTTRVDDFKKQAAELKGLDMYKNLSFDMNFDVYDSNDSMISVVFHIFTYLGGAHPFDEVETLTYDFKTNKMVTIEDLMKKNNNLLTVLSNFSYGKLKDETRIKEYSTDEWLKKGLEPKKENYKNFAVEKDDIIFYFGRYELGPYVAGSFQLAVPNETLNFQ